MDIWNGNFVKNQDVFLVSRDVFLVSRRIFGVPATLTTKLASEIIMVIWSGIFAERQSDTRRPCTERLAGVVSTALFGLITLFLAFLQFRVVFLTLFGDKMKSYLDKSEFRPLLHEAYASKFCVALGLGL